MVDSFGKERRRGTPDRRRYKEDRRNAERVAEEPLPRRDPERRERRDTDPDSGSDPTSSLPLA